MDLEQNLRNVDGEKSTWYRRRRSIGGEGANQACSPRCQRIALSLSEQHPLEHHDVGRLAESACKTGPCSRLQHPSTIGIPNNPKCFGPPRSAQLGFYINVQEVCGSTCRQLGAACTIWRYLSTWASCSAPFLVTTIGTLTTPASLNKTACQGLLASTFATWFCVGSKDLLGYGWGGLRCYARWHTLTKLCDTLSSQCSSNNILHFRSPPRENRGFFASCVPNRSSL